MSSTSPAKKKGRPKLPEGAKLSERSTFRFGQDTVRRLRRLSAQRGQRDSALLRDALEALEERGAVLRRLLELLRGGDAKAAAQRVQEMLDHQAAET